MHREDDVRTTLNVIITTEKCSVRLRHCRRTTKHDDSGKNVKQKTEIERQRNLTSAGHVPPMSDANTDTHRQTNTQRHTARNTIEHIQT